MVENENIKVNESIKLSKMSKGYNWEIRVFIPDQDELNIMTNDKKCILRLQELDNKLRERFGDGKEEV